MSNWTIFSNHGHVLVCLARDSESRLRDVAADVGLTERAVQKIVRDLQECGMISVSKHGRRNRYRIDHNKTLRHDLEAHCTLGELVDLVANEPITEMKSSTPESADIEPVELIPALEVPAVEVAVAEKPVEHKQFKPAAEEEGPKASKPAQSDSKTSIERQQGSLF
jgi:hypothetical protein